MNIQKGLLPIIAPSYWHEEADDHFREMCKEELKFNEILDFFA
jgi:hypothetical protein